MATCLKSVFVILAITVELTNSMSVSLLLKASSAVNENNILRRPASLELPRSENLIISPHHEEPETEAIDFSRDTEIRTIQTSVISYKIKNPATITQEMSFVVASAINVSLNSFIMEIDGISYRSTVQGKSAAETTYQTARDSEKATALITYRNTGVYNVALNIEPSKEIKFHFVYEKLLNKRSQNGLFEWIFTEPYSFVTESTSLVAVKTETSGTVTDSSRETDDREPGSSQEAVYTDLEGTAEEETQTGKEDQQETTVEEVSEGESPMEPEEALESETTLEPDIAAEGETTIEPEAEVEGETTIEPEAEVEGETTIEPEVTAEGETTIDPAVTAEGVTTIDPEVTAEGESTIDPEVTAESETTIESEMAVEEEVTAEPKETEEGLPSTEPEETKEDAVTTESETIAGEELPTEPGKTAEEQPEEATTVRGDTTEEESLVKLEEAVEEQPDGAGDEGEETESVKKGNSGKGDLSKGKAKKGSVLLGQIQVDVPSTNVDLVKKL